MAVNFDVKNVIKHLANGSLGKHICLLCLAPLVDKFSESIFTLISKEESDYCVADALEAVCQVKITCTEDYNVCIDCFKAATEAYKFQLQAKQSLEIISFYTQELLNNISNIEITNGDRGKLLCIPVLAYNPKTTLFGFNIGSIGKEAQNQGINQQDVSKEDIILVVKNETDNDEILKLETNNTEEDKEEMIMIVNEKKERKKRDPMVYISCTKCPIKYRFVSKLKVHMKSIHDIDVYYCKICRILSENRESYEEHAKGHKGEYQCTICCNAVFKKHSTLMLHMKTHEEKKNEVQLDNSNICEVCGAILPDEQALRDHMTTKHDKKFTCYYCGRMYKGEVSFDLHIKKHERHWARKFGTQTDRNKIDTQEDKQTDRRSKRIVCHTCGKDFVDERAMMWHQRLHNNDRPYTCEICGRSFVSAARRNQHSQCAHTRPARRCPLCPAVFHLRSMVNTHVKRVHVKEHKRRARSQNKPSVFWRTEAVPLQELSVDVQAHLLELRETQTSSTPYLDITQSRASL